jgi:hypothetical protein
MKIVITETQLEELSKTKPETFNKKPAELFDKKYGTKLSKRYSFVPYTEMELQKKWDKCILTENCDELGKCFEVIEKNFPYVKYGILGDETKYNILCGMLSRFNPQDILFFSISKVPYFLNKPQKELEEKLPDDVRNDIQWVLSPSSIDIIKNKFSIK